MDILNFSGIYERYELSCFKGASFIDLRDIHGTKLYVDSEGEKAVRDRIRREGSGKKAHLIDIGDYHYVTRLYLYEIREAFDLLVFDNHNDSKEPEFGGLRSCGSWIKDAVFDMPDTLMSVKLIRGDKDISYLKGSFDIERPLYISIDKDILSEDTCPTNWDQGDMSLEELLDFLRKETEGREILGIDICGGPASGSAIDREVRLNQAVDISILDALCYNH